MPDGAAALLVLTSALALVGVGVPLVLPLAVPTFAGAFILSVVQQVEGNLLQPLVVGRSVQVHPVAIPLAVTAGGVLGGIVGAFLATPIVGVLAAVLRCARFERAGG